MVAGCDGDVVAEDKDKRPMDTNHLCDKHVYESVDRLSIHYRMSYERIILQCARDFFVRVVVW